MSANEAERARRYLLAGQADLALGTCEAALASASGLGALSLHLQAAGAARALGDLAAEKLQLERAEAVAREAKLDVLGSVLTQLGEAELRRDAPAEAALALEEALGSLAADDPLRKRAEAALEEARAREEEGDDEEETPAPPPSPSTEPGAPPTLPAEEGGEWTERLLGMADRLLDADPELGLAELLDQVLAELVSAVDAERGFILLREPDGALVVRSARDQRGFTVLDPAKQVSRKIAERAAAELVSLRAVRPAEDPRFAGSRSAKALDLQAVVAAPLRYRNKDLGSVVLDRRAPDVAPFEASAEALVARFARLASGLIVRTRRRDAERKREEALTDLFARSAERLKDRLSIEGIVGQSQAIFRLVRLVERVAPTRTRVLIRGESGTGKELVAQTLHQNSPRKDQPFLALNCAALAESLLEAELFGYAEGAFTGAKEDRAGLFERADGGTLFLDEIGDAPPRLQAELLRVLQEGEVRRGGDAKPRPIDVRVITATHRDLETMVAEGGFREDLLYRINTVVLRVPPLRERREDVPVLAEHFYAEARAELPDPDSAPPLSAAVIDDLCDREWPGNVRELQNEIVRYVTLGELGEGLPASGGGRRARLLDDRLPLRHRDVLTLAEAERRALLTAYRAADGVKKEAARLLGINRRTLYNKLKSYGLE